MASDWLTTVTTFANVYPLRTSDEREDVIPQIAEPIDTGCYAVLNDLTGPNPRPELNPLDVEDLLDTVLDRLANCMTLREKAQDLEVQALSAALQYSTQKTVLASGRQLETAAAAVEPALLRNFSTVTLGGEVIRGGDQPNKEYWNNQSTERLKQLDAMDTALDALLNKSREPGNGSNYAERFAFLKELFFYNLRESYARARAVEVGLKEIYDIDLPVPTVVDVGYLNPFVLWAQKASDELDRALDSRYFGTLGLALVAQDEAPTDVEILKRGAEWNPRINTHTIEFNLSSKPFDWSGMQKPRLRGLDLRVVKGIEQYPKYWAARIDLPDQFLDRGSITYKVHANLPITMAESNYDRRPPGMRSIHNANPIGKWTIRLPSRSLTGQVTGSGEINNMLLFLRLSYEPL